MRSSKYFLLLLFLIIARAAPAQKPDTLVYNKARIDASLLVGFWETADSLKSRIEFVDSGFEILLHPYPGVYPYIFMKDSLNKVSVMGCSPNWPPYDCELNLPAPDTLVITYSQLGAPNYRKKFRRVKK